MPRNTAGLRRGGPGRPKGRLNAATLEVKALCRALLESPTYLRTLKKRLNAGKCSPAVETVIWYYAFGKPKDLVELDVFDRRLLETKSDEELAMMAEELARTFRGLGPGGAA